MCDMIRCARVRTGVGRSWHSRVPTGNMRRVHVEGVCVAGGWRRMT